MALIDELKKEGWHLTESGLKQVLEKLTCNSSLQNVKKAVLDYDLREIGGGALSTKRGTVIDGQIVLQIQKVRNISAPKANEASKAAPRFLQIELTDGQNSILGLEFQHLSTISQNTAPGTKVFLKNDKLNILQGYILLTPGCIEVLGGRVQHLVEKWEVMRNMQNYALADRHSHGASGPPAWVSFGCKVQLSKDNSTAENNFKSLQCTNEKEKSENSNVEEFNAMRSEAIAEASKLGHKKVFGGGGQQIVDHNMKKILSKGYSEIEAKEALRVTNNNLERALHKLKRVSQKQTKSETIGFQVNSKRKNDKEETTKRSDNVSLFDFLTSKIPETSVSSVAGNKINSTANTAGINENVSPKTEASLNPFKSHSAETTTNTFSKSTYLPPAADTNSYVKGNQRTYNSYKASDRIVKKFDAKSEAKTETKLVRKNGQNIKNGERNYHNAQEGGSKFPCTILNERDQLKGNAGKYFDNRSTKHNFKEKNRNYTNNENYGFQNKNSYGANKTGANKLQHTENSAGSSLNLKENQLKNRENTQTQSKTTLSSQSIANLPNTSKTLLTADITSTIIGFQNKTSNDLALNMLLSQGINDITFSMSSTHLNDKSSVSTAPSPGQQNQKFATNEPNRSQHKFNLNKQSTFSKPHGSKDMACTSSSTMQNHHINSNARNVNTQKNYHHTTPFEASKANYKSAHESSHAWSVGDSCFARYWDDGQFYAAKVTGISVNTLVVFFTEYGNYEEVLKTDCVPVNMVNVPPLMNTALVYSDASLPQMHHMSPGNNRNVMHANTIPPRYRTADRKVYVPPHKRNQILN